MVILTLVALVFINVVPVRAGTFSDMQKSALSNISSLISTIKPDKLSTTNSISLTNGYYATGISTMNNVFMYVWQPKSGSAYIYKWDANSNQWVLSQTITNLVKGAEEPQSVFKINYFTWKETGSSVTATVIGSDPTGSLSVKLVGPDAMYLSTTLSTSYNYTAYAIGGVQPYTFAFSPTPDSVNGSTATYTTKTLTNLGVNTIDITVTVTDKNGTQAKATMTVNLIKALTVKITGPTSLKLGDTGTFTASVFGGTGNYSYQFSVQSTPINTTNTQTTTTSTQTVSGGSTTSGYYTTVVFSTSNPASYTFRTAAYYLISVTVKDLKAGIQGTDSMQVKVDSSLTVTISGPSSLKKGDTGTFTATASGGTGNYSYQFYVDDSLVSTGSSSASYTFLNEGSHTVSFTVSDIKTGLKGTASMLVNVISSLTVTISGPTSLKPGDTGTFTATVSGGSGNYSYDFYVTYIPNNTSQPGVYVPQVIPNAVVEDFGSTNPSSYTFTDENDYTVGVIVTDGRTNVQGEASMSVSVRQEKSPVPVNPPTVPSNT